jgi:putative membrane protein
MNLLLPLVLLMDERARPTGPFEWAWSLHPSVLIGTGLLGALYFWGIGPLRRRHALGPPAEPWRVALFLGGLLVLLFALNGPMHDLSDYYLFSAHMVQHLLLTLVFPPMLIAGTPAWLWGRLVRPAPVRALGRVLTKPVVAAVIYTVTIAVWHLTPFYELMMRNHEVHIATHLMFIVAATIFWWPVMSSVPELPRLGYGMGMLYLFLAGIPMQIVAALITLTDEVLYPWYSVAPRTWGLTPLDDQQVGGLLMWVPGNLYMFLAIGVLFLLWARESK